MRNYKLLPLLALLILGYAGCETTIPIELPDHTPQLTVNSTFTPDSVWGINLSSSVGIGEADDPSIIEDGMVVVYADGVVLDTFVHAAWGFYLPQGSASPVAGVTYEVVASAPGFDPVRANTTIPAPVSILGGSVEENAVAFGDDQSEIKFEFQDPPGSNYYFIAMVYNDSIDPGQPFYLESQDPVLGATELFSDWSYQGLLFTDISFDGELKEITLITYRNLVSGFHRLIMGTLTEEYYRYALTHSAAAETEGNPFAEPVSIHSNVEGGYGIFAGFSTSFFNL